MGLESSILGPMRNTVSLCSPDLTVRTQHPKNLGWLARNISHITEVDAFRICDGTGMLVVSGKRKEEHFTGVFHFDDAYVMRTWVKARRTLKSLRIRWSGFL